MLQVETQKVKVTTVWLSPPDPGGGGRVEEGSAWKAHGGAEGSCTWAHLSLGESLLVLTGIKFSHIWVLLCTEGKLIITPES